MQWARKDQQPHVELQIFWEKQSSQIVKALIYTGVEAFLICGKPKKSMGNLIITGPERKQIEAMQTQTEMKIGNLLLSYDCSCP